MWASCARCCDYAGSPLGTIGASISLIRNMGTYLFNISFHFIFNSLNRVKVSITKITALQLALSTKKKTIEKKTYLQFYVAANV